MNELNGLVLVLHFDAALGAGGEKLLHELGAAGEAFAHDAAGAAQTRIRHRADLAELDADVLFEPVDAGGDVIRVAAVEGLVAHLLGDVHHHGVEVVGRVLDALFGLVARAPAADGAEGEDGVAVGTVALFEHDDLGAGVVGRDGGDQAGRTCAENDGVIGLGVGGLFCLGLGGEAEAGGAGSGGAEEGGLEKTAAAHIGMRHC